VGFLPSSAPKNSLRESLFRSFDFSYRNMIPLILIFCNSMGCSAPLEEKKPFKNIPPYAPIVSLSPLAPTTQDTIVSTLIFDTEDPDGDPISLSYTWRKDGVEQQINGDSVQSFQTKKGEVWSLNAYTFDGSLKSTTVSVSTTIRNSPPRILSIPQDSTPSSTEDLILEEIQTEDLDGDSVRIFITWIKDGIEMPSFEGDLLISKEYTKKDEMWEAYLTPHDGSGAGTPQIQSFVIQNTAPKVLSVSITPQEAYENTIISAEVEGFDSDNDILSYLYEWRINGLSVSTDETLDGGQFNRGNAIELDIRAFDGNEESTPLRSMPIIILNSPPTLSSLTLTPITASTDDQLNCLAIADDDIDGDDTFIEYEWFINGQYTSTSNTLESNLFQKNDLIECVATIFDQNDQSTLETSITIQNSPPLPQSISLTDPASMLDILYCEISSIDADDDPILHEYNWFVFGALINHSNSFIDPQDSFLGLLPEDELYCSATPSDGESIGSTLTSNITTLLPGYIEVSGVLFLNNNPIAGIPLLSSTLPLITDISSDIDGSYALSIPTLSTMSISASIENNTSPQSFSLDFTQGTIQTQNISILDTHFPIESDLFDPDNGYLDINDFAGTMYSSDITSDQALQYRTLYPPGEEDWVRVSLSNQETYSFITTFSHHTSNIILFVYNDLGEQVATSTAYLGNDSLIATFTPTQTGDYFIMVDTVESNDVASYLLGVFPSEDVDGDGHISFYDCDDTDATIHPLSSEVILDGIDQNCDGTDLSDPSTPDFTEALGVQHFESIIHQESHPDNPLYTTTSIYSLHSSADLDRFTISVPAKSKSRIMIKLYAESTIRVDILDGNTLLTSYTSNDEMYLTNPSSITKEFSVYIRNNIIGTPVNYRILALDYGTDNDLDGFYSRDTNTLRDDDDGNPAIHP
jgi:hypothetical protein